MKIIQSGIFKRKVKRLKKEEKLQLDEAIRAILKNPNIGDEKKGDLQHVHVSKFQLNTISYLITYRFSEETLELIMLGPHENYYSV